MARARVKKKDEFSQDGQPLWPFLVIIFLLTIQTVFLFYKNRNFVADIFKVDPNSIFGEEIEKEKNEQSKSVISETASSTVDPSKIRVSILNGCGTPGLASTWKDKLRKMEYDIRETGNASQKYEKTIILSRSRDMKLSNFVAENLGVKKENIIMQLNKDLVDIDVTVIIGADYKDFNLK